MILECPSCGTRYLVQIGLFATGGRTVRCARCRHQWFVELPKHVDVVLPLPTPEPAFASANASPSGAAMGGGDTPRARTPTRNLPAVIQRKPIPKVFWFVLAGIMAVAILIFALIEQRDPIVKALPFMRGVFINAGLFVAPEWDGLVFDAVRSELKYDSGTMKLYVDGVVYNPTSDSKPIPDIEARALGPDRAVVQSWRVESPAPTIGAGEKVSFHTEVATSMERTIEDLYLEFTSRKD